MVIIKERKKKNVEKKATRFVNRMREKGKGN